MDTSDVGPLMRQQLPGSVALHHLHLQATNLSETARSPRLRFDGVDMMGDGVIAHDGDGKGPSCSVLLIDIDLVLVRYRNRSA